MAKCGRPPVLDEIKKREILAILTVGCSRRVAAAYVGCSPSTIRSTAQRDSRFAEQLRHADHQAELGYLSTIQKAGSQERYWRAAAWALERKNPEDFAPRHPDIVTLDQIAQLMTDFARLIEEEIPVAIYRQNVLKRLDESQRRLGIPQRKASRKAGESESDD